MNNPTKPVLRCSPFPGQLRLGDEKWLCGLYHGVREADLKRDSLKVREPNQASLSGPTVAIDRVKSSRL